MTYAEAIKKLRNKMLLTQMEFAEYLGVSFASINRWETGRFEPTMTFSNTSGTYHILNEEDEYISSGNWAINE